jgi:hypothetical protein
VKTPMGMSTRLFWSLVGGEDRRKLWEVITKDEFDDAETRLMQVLGRLMDARMDRPDADLIVDEVRNGAAMLIHACRHGRWRLGVERFPTAILEGSLRGILDEHRRLWHARNRTGGLVDSCRRLEARLADYGATP